MVRLSYRDKNRMDSWGEGGRKEEELEFETPRPTRLPVAF